MKRIAALSMIALLPLLAACHTIQGVGQDITAVGKGLERSTK
jgi:predicted small secreted protein